MARSPDHDATDDLQNLDFDHRPVVRALRLPRKYARGWKRVFLVALSRSANPTQARLIAGCSYSAVENTRRKDPVFAAKYHEALEIARDRLVSVAWEEAVDGVLETVYYEGKSIGTRRVRNQPLLALLLKAYLPDVFSERYRVAKMGAEVIGDLTRRRTEALEAAQERIVHLLPSRELLSEDAPPNALPELARVAREVSREAGIIDITPTDADLTDDDSGDDVAGDDDDDLDDNDDLDDGDDNDFA